MKSFNRMLAVAAVCALPAGMAAAEDTAQSVVDDIRMALNDCRDGEANGRNSCAEALRDIYRERCEALSTAVSTAEKLARLEADAAAISCKAQVSSDIDNTKDFTFFVNHSNPEGFGLTCESLQEGNMNVFNEFTADIAFLDDLKNLPACQKLGLLGK